MSGDAVHNRDRWLVHRDRLVDEDPHIRVSLADVELPDGTEFTQYVFRLRRCAMIAVLDEPGTRILLLRRHRFIIGRWVWELPGGYVDDGEDGQAAAIREAEEETGWRPRSARFVLSFQPMIGNADFPQDLYLARGADLVREPETDEAAEVGWISLDDAAAMIADGRIAGAATVIGVQHALMLRADTRWEAIPPAARAASPATAARAARLRLSPPGSASALSTPRCARSLQRSGGCCR